MQPRDIQRVQAAMALTPEACQDPETAAHLVAGMWQDIETALRPVLGGKGVAALYGRCLHLAAPTHPWLDGLRDPAATTIDLAELRSVLSQRTFIEVAASGDLLLQTLHDLLVSLVGAPLTDRLLNFVLVPPASARDAQDINL